MQLRSGHDTQDAMTPREEEALMAELYPTPDPGANRASAEDIMISLKFISKDTSQTEEDRLRNLHRMLELCAVEHESEVRGYQVAHRHLIEYEQRYSRMMTYPDVPEESYDSWASWLDKHMKVERLKMRHSRENTKALLKTIDYAERKVRNTEKKFASQGKNNRAVRESNLLFENHRAKLERLGIAELTDQISQPDHDQSVLTPEEGRSPALLEPAEKSAEE